MVWTTWLHVCHCVPGDLHNMESKVLPLQKDMPLCLAEAINVPVPPLQGEWYLSSLIRNICCAHARSLSLPPLSPKGILPHPPSLRKQRIFLIVYPPPPLPPACLFVCQQVIKICLLLPRRSTPVETAAAEPRSWSPLLHADDLNVEKMKNNTPPNNHREPFRAERHIWTHLFSEWAPTFVGTKQPDEGFYLVLSSSPNSDSHCNEFSLLWGRCRCSGTCFAWCCWDRSKWRTPFIQVWTAVVSVY